MPPTVLCDFLKKPLELQLANFFFFFLVVHESASFTLIVFIPHIFNNFIRLFYNYNSYFTVISPFNCKYIIIIIIIVYFN